MCGCAEGWIFGYGDIQMCISSGIRIDGIMGRCIIIGFVVDSVVFGRRKVFHARRAEQQLERQGGRKDGSVWSFAACLCGKPSPPLQIQILKQILVQIQVKMDQCGRFQLVCTKLLPALQMKY